MEPIEFRNSVGEVWLLLPLDGGLAIASVGGHGALTLTPEQALALAAHLQRFGETGNLDVAQMPEEMPT